MTWGVGRAADGGISSRGQREVRGSPCPLSPSLRGEGEGEGLPLVRADAAPHPDPLPVTRSHCGERGEAARRRERPPPTPGAAAPASPRGERRVRVGRSPPRWKRDQHSKSPVRLSAFPGSEHWARPERSFAGWDAGLAIHSGLRRWALTWILMPLRVAPLRLPTQSHQIIKDAIRPPRNLSTGLPKHTAACFSRPKPPPSGTHADRPLSGATRNLCFRIQIF